MKTERFKNIRVLGAFALLILSLSSCLKDPRYVDFSASPALIEFPLAGYYTNKTSLISIYTSTTTAPQTTPNTVHTKNTDASGKYTLQVAVNLAYHTTLDANTTVTVVVDNTLLTAAAPSMATTTQVTPATTSTAIPQYYPLPTAAYSISNLTPVIAGGQHLAYFNVVIDANQIPNSNLPLFIAPTVAVPNPVTAYKNYALRFVIKDGGGQQISSFNAIVYQIQASL